MTPKELTKLAKACRAAGIRHFKNADIEFTLTDEAPVSTYKKKAAETTAYEATAAKFESDELSEEQLMAWSLPDPVEEKAEE